MKGKILIFLLGLFLIAIPALTQKASLDHLEGDVKLNSVPADFDILISSGDELSTQNGRVEIYLNGSYLWLNTHSKVVFASLQEESILLDLRYGEVYVRTENEIGIQTPHDSFTVNGQYRIEVDRFETKKYPNLRLVDDFDKWTDQREKKLFSADYEGNDERSYYDYEGEAWYPWSWNMAWHPYWYGVWAPVWYYHNYYPYAYHSYWHWGSWYWHLGWHPFWSWTWYPWYYSRWSYYSYYPYYSSYYNYPFRYDPYISGRAFTKIRKDQLQRRPVQNIGAKQLRETTRTTATFKQRSSQIARPSVKSIGSRTIRKYPSRIKSPGNLRSSYSSASRVRGSQRSYSGTQSRSIYQRSYSSGSSSRYIGSRSSYRSRSLNLSRSASRYSRSSYSRTIAPRSYSRYSFSRSLSRPSFGSSFRSSGSFRSSRSTGKVRKN